MECREQQLLNQSLQNEQDKCQLQAKIEVQGADLLKVQQELERVQRLYQQECRSTATHKASAAAAWWVWCCAWPGSCAASTVAALHKTLWLWALRRCGVADP